MGLSTPAILSLSVLFLQLASFSVICYVINGKDKEETREVSELKTIVVQY